MTIDRPAAVRGNPIDPQPIVEWALDPARDDDDESVLVADLIGLLEAAGVSLSRVGTSFRPIDPQVWVRNLTWERGELQLRDRDRDILTSPGYVGSAIEAIHQGAGAIRERLDAAPLRYPQLAELAARGMTDYVIQPIPLNREIRTFISYACDRAGGFTADELALLGAILPAVSALVRLRSTRLTVGSLARTYLGANAAARVLDGAVERGKGERIQAAIWFCDLRDFTVLSDALPPDRLLKILDDYFEAVADPVADQCGEVLKFIGDAMLAIFPVTCTTAETEVRDVCARATLAAVTALERFEIDVNQRHRTEVGRDLGIGVSLHFGEVFYGNIGARDRLDFTVIGPAVNLAARVQGQCSTLGTPLLITQAVADHLGRDDVRSLGSRPLKGIATPPTLFTLGRFVR